VRGNRPSFQLRSGHPRELRVSEDGEIILLVDQDRARWDHKLISEGTALLEQALRSRRFGAYTLQAAISAVHSEAATAAQTDWNQIIVLYSVLQRIDSSPVIELNRAVAVAILKNSARDVDYGLAHSTNRR
jgi:RNA polymerase sigma-70 factor, ECF subfamily